MFIIHLLHVSLYTVVFPNRVQSWNVNIPCAPAIPPDPLSYSSTLYFILKISTAVVPRVYLLILLPHSAQPEEAWYATGEKYKNSFFLYNWIIKQCQKFAKAGFVFFAADEAKNGAARYTQKNIIEDQLPQSQVINCKTSPSSVLAQHEYCEVELKGKKAPLTRNWTGTAT